MSTYFPSGKDLAGKRKWYVVDAAGQTVGHLASEVASILTGNAIRRGLRLWIWAIT
jgi:ribosomal protein L13